MVSLLYGIALEEGIVPALDAKLLESFPQYADLAADKVRASWTIGHVMNMALGTEWDESLPYSDPNNSEIQMEMAADRYRFILDRPIVNEPGEVWNYNGGCSALLGYLITKGAGVSVKRYAREKLFKPLSIYDIGWIKGRDGVHSTAAGLRMTLPDLAKVGELVLRGGTWQGDRIVPKDWLEMLKKPVIRTKWGRMSYSHQWYSSDQPALGKSTQVQTAIGNGGQRLFIVPEYEIVIAIFTGNYNQKNTWLAPYLILKEIVLDGLRRG